MITRETCPVCGEHGAKFLVRMGPEYLVTSSNGWQYDPEYLEVAGLDFDSDSQGGCSYYECTSCGTFYLRELFDMEEANDESHRRHPERQREPYLNHSHTTIESYVGRAESVSKMVTMAIPSSDTDSLSVLDYGCGGGVDLGFMKTLGVDGVVGYDNTSAQFDVIRNFIHRDIELVSEKQRLATHAPFDAIRCNAVLEHVFEPNETVDHVNSLLRPNGIAYFYAPCITRREMAGYVKRVENGVRVKNLHPGHVQLWNADSLPLSKYIEDRGFKVIPLLYSTPVRDTTTFRGLADTFYAHGRRGVGMLRNAIAFKLGMHHASACYGKKGDGT